MMGELQARVSRASVYPVEEYDAYVANHPLATPYHYSCWLTAVERAYRHTGWLVTVHRGSNLCGVLPLIEIKPPVGVSTLVSLPFCDLAGALADDCDVRNLLLTEAHTLAGTNKVRELEIREGGGALEELDLASGSGSPKVRMLSSLPNDANALFQSFKPKLRSQIRKAEKNGLISEVRKDSAAVEYFYDVFAWNMRRLGSPVHSRDWFRELKRAYGDQMLVGLVFLNDQPVGAGIVLMTGNKACIPWASTLEKYNRLAPNMLLYWALLSYVCEHGCTTFDYGRSTLGEGTYRFKKQWGAKPYELVWTRWLIEESVKSESERAEQRGPVSRLRPVLEGIWRRLPLAVANWIGPKLRRYITL
ncbi:FemAB family XrtA/PEP-CTERM system-associated protein [Marinobacter adhaerens]|uniref:FemAB family XrtA/PEP-CTERM system-associated protein n=1 Tax=Marinobacter adhaerens TaxID=1033846 RepID=UPI001E4ACDB5|nr:FemAB family XrtA/PEP-CTERM system-associated protein [Marinobacter adhaerens]MCD1647040.1 FemAB family PEP-CTERM system-associated protein [Marinobacter adhaerens]